MKRQPTGRSTAVYDFDEGDAEPFSTKRAKSHKRTQLFQSFFKGTYEGRGGGKDQRNNCKDLTKRRLNKNMCRENLFAEETNVGQSSSVSDVIETDDSDSEPNQLRRDLNMRFGGAVGVSIGVCRNEDPRAEESRKVGIQGEELWFLDKKYSSPEFIFTAAGIELKTQAFGAVELPLSMLKNFRSGSHEEGLFFIALNLTEHGVKCLQQHLGHLDNCTSCHTIFSTFSDKNSRVEKIKQITSLSDGYKLIWRPEKENLRHHYEKFGNIICRDRDGSGNGENDHLLGDCFLRRSRASLNDWWDLIYPTEDDRDAVTVTKYDFLLLDPDQFLSDTIIDFYIKYLQSQIPEADKGRFYFYNSFFFRKLTEVDKNPQYGYDKSKSSFERVKRWTAGVKIFDKDYLFIPVMQSAHWSLVIICHPGYLSEGCSDEGDYKAPLILHLDSLEGCHTYVEEPIRSYLVEAWRERNGRNEDSEILHTLKFEALQVPQQTNYSDCGLFLLHYVELFIKKVLENDSTDVAFHEWFNPADASGKRAHIQSLIQGLRAKKSAGEHVRPQYLKDTYIMRPSEVAQTAVSFGRDVCDVNKTAIHSGYLFDQPLSMLVSCHQQHENDLQCACTRLGHDHVELGYVEVVEEQHDFCHCCQHDSFDERDQGAKVNHVRTILMPSCTHVEDSCVVQRYGDYVSRDDSLECVVSDVDMKDVPALVREANNRPDECTVKKVEDGSVKSNAVEERLTSASSDPFVNSSTAFGVAFCCHYDDETIFDRRVCSAGKLSLDDTSHEQVFQTCSTSSDSSAEEAGKQLKEIDSVIDGTKVVVQESKDDSLVDLCVWLEGKESVNIDSNNAIIEQSAVDSHQEIGMDCMEGSKLQLLREVAAANQSSEGSILQKEVDSLVPTFKERAVYVSTLLSTADEESRAHEAELDGPASVSTDRGLMSKIVKGSGDGERDWGSQRRNKQCKVGCVARRITRSSTKGEV